VGGTTRDTDFSNNGVVAAEDYAFLLDQWLTTSACACALTWLPGGPLGRPALGAEVGNELQAKADLNRDGRVDDRDVELFELQHGLPGELSRARRASRQARTARRSPCSAYFSSTCASSSLRSARTCALTLSSRAFAPEAGKTRSATARGASPASRPCM
jgi:hypothetical protein